MGLHVLTLRVWLPRISAMEIMSAEMSYQRWAPDTFDSAVFNLLRDLNDGDHESGGV